MAKHPGIGRLVYIPGLLVCTVLTLVGNAQHIAPLLLLGVAANLLLAAGRLRNIGMSGWWALLLPVPILNLLVIFRCVVLPPGFEETRTLDSSAKLIAVGVAAVALFPFAFALSRLT